VAGDELPVRVETVATRASRTTANDPLVVAVTVLNSGALHVNASIQGVLMRRGDAGLSVVGRLAPRNTRTLAPGQRRTVVGEWTAELEPGTYQANGTVLARDIVAPFTVNFTVADDGTVGATEPTPPSVDGSSNP
jgi:hypothetical protein